MLTDSKTKERRTDTLIRKSAQNGMPDTKEQNRRPPMAKKTTPPDQTNAEQFYYSKQMQGKTHMVVVLTDGEKLEGIIEWYDRGCLKLNRVGAPNLLLFKHCIKYMYKAEPE
jgi:sRNA-binding regulator protein Hfq